MTSISELEKELNKMKYKLLSFKVQRKGDKISYSPASTKIRKITLTLRAHIADLTLEQTLKCILTKSEFLLWLVT